VQFRIRGDLTALDEPRPKLRVSVEAQPNTPIVIDGRALALDASGKGVFEIDVASELTGASAIATTLERDIPYTITPPHSPAQSGEVRMKIRVVPLLVSAPGDSIVIERATFMLAGTTQPNTTVSVAGRPIAVDAAGQFAQLMSVSAIGETTIEVRASAPKHAPRLFPLHIKRVESIAAEAKSFAANASIGLRALGSDPELKKGWAIVLEGTIVEVRNQQHTSVALLDVKQGCVSEPCLVRVVYGAELPYTSGTKVRAFGHVQGTVEGPRTGTRIPEVRADFVLAGTRP
jgi:hypothetical protein